MLPPSLAPDLPARALSLLQEMMEAFEGASGLRVSFDDLTGIHTGAHEDVPAMRLDYDHQQHICKFCQFAKTSDRGNRDCVRNKVIVNWLVIRRRAGLHGLCHLGLLDLVEPLVYRGLVLGVFYAGSVLLRGSEEVARERIRRYCARHGWNPQPYFDHLADLPAVDSEQIPAHRQTLRMIVHAAHFFYETGGVRPEMYRFRALEYSYRDPQAMPFVVKAALEYIRAHLHERFGVKEIAAYMRCHPDFLGRKFKQHAGIDLSIYLQDARIDCSKRLLENPRVTIEEASEQSGFANRFHFSRVFRRVTGTSPAAFQKESQRIKTNS